jgi:hypothetical protein
MTEPLQPDYIAQCERDARRFQGAYIGTSGTLAAHVMRLLRERERLVVLLARFEERQAVCLDCHRQ